LFHRLPISRGKQGRKILTFSVVRTLREMELLRKTKRKKKKGIRGASTNEVHIDGGS